MSADGDRVYDIRVEAVISLWLGRRGDRRVFSGPGHTRLSPRLPMFRQYRYARFFRIFGQIAKPFTFVSHTPGDCKSYPDRRKWR